MVLPVVKVYSPILVPGILNKAKSDFRFCHLTSRRVDGFTLLELMIVIVIISILFTFTALTIRDRSPEDLIREEALRLNRLTQLALEEAVLKNTEYALEFKTNSYRFLSYIDGRWQALSGDKLLRERELPNEMEVELAIEQIDIIIGKNPDANGNSNEDSVIKSTYLEEDEPKPQVFLLSSEEITPDFSARFILPGIETSYIVSGHIDGKLETALSEF